MGPCTMGAQPCTVKVIRVAMAARLRSGTKVARLRRAATAARGCAGEVMRRASGAAVRRVVGRPTGRDRGPLGWRNRPRLARWGVPALCGLALLTGLLAWPGRAAAEVEGYVLALSWSPTYCEGPDGDEAPLQCDPDADHTFIVHGLWPERADGPSDYCDTGAAPSRATVEAMLDIMPSRGLVRHQWRKHGTCSGREPAAYFAQVRQAYEALAVPPGLATLGEDITARPATLREAFIAANPGLPADGIYVSCRADRLVEVRVCLGPDLGFAPCPNVGRRRCRSDLLEVPAPE